MKPVSQLLPKFLRQAAKEHPAAQLPLDEDGIKALYLLLLGRMPEGEAAYRDRRGMPAAQLIADMLASAEFRDRVLGPFLAGGKVPQEGLGAAEFDFVRAWTGRAGIALPLAAPDLRAVLVNFLIVEPAAAALTQALPAEAAALRRGAAAEAARPAGERAERLRQEEVARRLEALEERLRALETGWRQHVPAFLNAVSSVGAFAHEQARLAREVGGLRRDLDAVMKAAGGVTAVTAKEDA